MLSALFNFLRPTRPSEWTLAELDAVLASERNAGQPAPRTPYPWLANAQPLPKRTGRAHLRLVVNR